MLKVKFAMAKNITDTVEIFDANVPMTNRQTQTDCAIITIDLLAAAKYPHLPNFLWPP